MFIATLFALFIVSLRIIHAGAKAGRYYIEKLKKSVDEYYVGRSNSEGEEVIGHWWGGGLKYLGLKPDQPIYINDLHFKTVIDNRHPVTFDVLRQGKTRIYTNPKTGRQKTYHVVAGIDITTSNPKEVSIFRAISSLADRKKAQAADARANRALIEEIQRELAEVRTGKAGKNREKVELAVAQFEHVSSRAGDVQFHTHNVIMAIGYRADGKWGALDIKQILKSHVPIDLGQYYRDRLRHELKVEFPHLRFPTIPITNGTSFRVVGVNGQEIPKSLVQSLSSRRAQIEEAHKLNPKKPMHEIAVQTRGRKVEVLDEEGFYAKHRAIAKAHGLERSAFEALSQEWSLATYPLEPMVEAIREEATHRTVGGLTEPIVRTPKGWSPRARPEFIEERPSDPFRKAPSSTKVKSLIGEIRTRIRQTYLPLRITHDYGLALDRAKAASKRKATSWKIRQLLGLSPKPKRQPRTKFGIELKYLAGGLKLSQRLYLRTKYGHGLPKYFISRSKLAINVAYATKSVTKQQQLMLLKHFGHLHEHSPEIRSITRKPSPKRK